MIHSIRTDTLAKETLRNMRLADKGLRENMKRISTGRVNNSAEDDPSNLTLVGGLNNQLLSTEQAIKNNEIATMFVQTAEATLSEISAMLIRIRQLAVHASNEGVNDERSLAADQGEIDNILESIDQISEMSLFGGRHLLDGSNGTLAFTSGDGLRVLGTTEKTESSPAGGYAVNVKSLATRGNLTGARRISAEEVANGGIFLEFEMGGQHLSHVTKPGHTAEHLVAILQKKLDANRLPMDISLTEDGRFKVVNKEYGEEPAFTVASSADGLFTSAGLKIETSKKGLNVAGTIGGYEAEGKGRELIAKEGTPVEGMRLIYDGSLNVAEDERGLLNKDGNLAENPGEPLVESNEIEPLKGGAEGVVFVENNSLFFQIGGGKFEHALLDLKSSKSEALGREVENESGFRNLSEISVLDFQKSQDTMRVLDKAISEIASTRAEIGAIQANVFERNVSNLNLSYENLAEAKSRLSDANVAKEVAELTRNKMWMETASSILGKSANYKTDYASLLRN